VATTQTKIDGVAVGRVTGRSATTCSAKRHRRLKGGERGARSVARRRERPCPGGVAHDRLRGLCWKDVMIGLIGYNRSCGEFRRGVGFDRGGDKVDRNAIAWICRNVLNRILCGVCSNCSVLCSIVLHTCSICCMVL
jgi:hypothetical protein